MYYEYIVYILYFGSTKLPVTSNLLIEAVGGEVCWVVGLGDLYCQNLFTASVVRCYVRPFLNGERLAIIVHKRFVLRDN